MQKHVTAAGKLRPDDPVTEYSHGLVYLSRSQYSRAAAKFRSVIKDRPAFLPCWKMLLVMRVDRKQRRQLHSELTSLTDAISGTSVKWANDAERKTAAKFVGRIIGFLRLPDVKVLAAASLNSLQAKIEKRLSPQFSQAFAAGRQQLLADRRKLKDEVAAAIATRTKRRHSEDAERVADAGKRRTALKQQSESLERSASQWKVWIAAQLEKNQKQLTELQKDYRTLETADARLAGLAAQANVDCRKLQTEYVLRRLRRASAAVQPPVLRLQAEIRRYQRERNNLQQQAGRVQASARALFAARSAAMQKYKKATGEIVKNSASIERWQKHLQTSTFRAKKKAATSLHSRTMAKRLTRVASYFDFDSKTEATRILKIYDQPTQSNSDATR